MSKIDKIRKFINEHYVILIPISLIVILILTFGIYNIHRLYVNHTTDHNVFLYQYFAGKKVEFDGILKVNRDDDIVKVETPNQKITFSSVPVYFKNTDDKVKVLFPKMMNIIRPLSNYTQNKTVNYSTIIWDEANTLYTLKSNDFNDEITNSILYDGVDLYFFTNETVISIDKKEVTLSPMSYIRVNVGNSLEYYDYANDKYEMIEITTEKVIAKNRDFEIDLSGDKTYNYDMLILLLDPSNLNEIK